MARPSDDAAYLAHLQDYYARWHSQPAYTALQAVLGLTSRAGIGKVLKRLRDAGYLERTPAGRWTPTSRFFERPLADGARHSDCEMRNLIGDDIDHVRALAFQIVLR